MQRGSRAKSSRHLRPTAPARSEVQLPLRRGHAEDGAALARERGGDGERSRSQLHFELGGAGNLSFLAVHALAVNVLAVNSVS